MKINARKLLEYSTEELWSILTGPLVLQFDDGELETNYRATLYSSYVWDLHRQFPNTPFLKKHHVDSHIKQGHVTSSTHTTLIGAVTWDLYEHQKQSRDEAGKEELRSHLARRAYEITNLMYNDLIVRLEEYVISVDILDCLQVLKHPRVQAANEAAKPNALSIEATYLENRKAFQEPELRDNPVTALFKAGLVGDKQLNQCFGPRGYLTDADSVAFEHPIMRSYVQGIRNIHDSLIESRAATKALIFTKAPLKDTEYFSRRLQLVSLGVKNLHHGDCGSGQYLAWNVRGKEVVGDTVVWKGDLKNIAGKYYLDELTNTLKVVKESDNHLIGRKIKMRTVLHCAHSDPMGVCSTCFGQISESIAPGSNIGHLCCAELAQQSSQSVLSVKHLDNSAIVDEAVLSEEERLYMKVSKDGLQYLLADSMKNKKVTLAIPIKQAINLIDVNEVKSVTELSIVRLSEFKDITLIVNHGEYTDPVTINVSMDRRLSSLTHELLEHIRQKGWKEDDRGYYLVDLAGWDHSKPLLALPMRQFNMADHSKQISDLLESTKKETDQRDQYVHPTSLLGDLFTLVNSKLSVNLAMLEITLYAAMIVSAKNYDYSLPKPWTSSGVGVMRNTMKYRSLASQMAYQGHHETIMSPTSYLLTNRVDHPFDAILMPREVVESGQNATVYS